VNIWGALHRAHLGCMITDRADIMPHHLKGDIRDEGIHQWIARCRYTSSECLLFIMDAEKTGLTLYTAATPNG